MAAAGLTAESLLHCPGVAPGDREAHKSIEGGLDGRALGMREGVHDRGHGGDGQGRPLHLDPQLHVMDVPRLRLAVGPWSLVT